MTQLQPIFIACLGFAGLFFGLSFLMAAIRSGLVLGGKRTAGSFVSGGTDVSPFMNRLTRARDNYYENMGALALIVLVAWAAGQVETLNGLAYVFLAARAGQSTAHLISTSSRVVVVRAVCFVIQVAVQMYWIVRLLFVPVAG